MKTVKTIFALAFGIMVTLTSCGDTKTKTETTEDHGHEHDEDGKHKEEKVIGQEEFKVDKDSLDTKEEIHTHDDSKENHNH
ncbi:MAG: hypothetical protein Q8S44_04500 [Flavobacteriaceae bacterium]|nr:hypothetical protein [Flavobacteriaceae bacterium]